MKLSNKIIYDAVFPALGVGVAICVGALALTAIALAIKFLFDK